MKRLAPLPLLILMSASCVSLKSVSLTQIPTERNNVVSAEASKTIILGINFDNDYVDEVAKRLRSRCPNGVISGILTKDESTNYFIGIVVKRTVTATGYCQRSGGRKA